jgi:site-specific DNA-cytosine methylase
MSVTNAGGKPGQGYAAVLDAAEILTFKVRGGVERDSAGKMAGKGYLGTTDEVFTIGTSPDQHIFDARGNGEGAVCPTLAGDHQNRVTDYTAIVVPESFRMVAFGEYDTDGTASAIKARDWKDATDLVVAPASLPRPRRLTPLECERLMGWPDGWTALPGAKDTPRYKACGNGVMSPVAGWIGWQLRAAIELEDLVG